MLYTYLLIIAIFNNIYAKQLIIAWGLGIGDWGLGPIPNPQSPQNNIFSYKNNIYLRIKYLLIIFIYLLTIQILSQNLKNFNLSCLKISTSSKIVISFFRTINKSNN